VEFAEQKMTLLQVAQSLSIIASALAIVVAPVA